MASEMAVHTTHVEAERAEHRVGWSPDRLQRATTGIRVAFGLVWLIDGIMKFVYLQASDVADLVQGAGQGQPAWLSGWYSFWASTVAANPGAFLTGIGALEILLGLALVVGLARRTAYLGGIALSFMIWAVDEGFGGPYGPGSTDIGAAVMYIFVFATLLVIDAALGSSAYSLDRVIERRIAGWRVLAEA